MDEFKDIYLDILQNEKSGLIEIIFEFDAEKTTSYL